MKQTQTEIEKLLIGHEGLKQFPYKCTAGKITIGIGRNLTDKGITEEEALYLLKNDIKECVSDLNLIFVDIETFPDNVQLVLISMRFQLGNNGFKQFRKMITAFIVKDYEEAVVQMKDSNWYKQVPARANDLIKLIETT